jgi:hypothetical protein
MSTSANSLKCAECGASILGGYVYHQDGTAYHPGCQVRHESQAAKLAALQTELANQKASAHSAWNAAVARDEQVERLTAELAAAKRDADALRAAGAELVACKALKESIESAMRSTIWGRQHTVESNAMRDDYNRRKPLAWDAMRAALAQTAAPPAQPAGEFTYAELEQKVVDLLADNQRLDHALKVAQPAGELPGLDDDAICRLAERCNLGVALRPIGLDTGLVFAVHGHYLTSELLDFARAAIAAHSGKGE